MLQEEGIEQFVGAKPVDEELLVSREVGLADSHEEEQAEEEHPEEHAGIAVHPSERPYDQGKEGAVVVHVVVLQRIVVEQRELLKGVIPDANEDAVIAVAVVGLGDGEYEAHQHPQDEDGAIVVEEGVLQDLRNVVA